MRFVEADQVAAEIRLEDVGQDQDRGLDLEPGEAFRRRQSLEIREERRAVAAVRREGRTWSTRRVGSSTTQNGRMATCPAAEPSSFGTAP
jgi:hypothetical protein